MDRSTYRTLEDQRLIEEAKNNPNRELSIVLGERLEDIMAEHAERLDVAIERAKDAEIDANQLDDKVYELQIEIANMQLIIDGMAAEIKHLKETAK